MRSSASPNSSGMYKVDIIGTQLDKLREVAMSATSDKMDLFSSHLAMFGERWRDRLQAAFVEPEEGDDEVDQADDEQRNEYQPSDPNASPPILPASSSSVLKMEGV